MRLFLGLIIFLFERFTTIIGINDRLENRGDAKDAKHPFGNIVIDERHCTVQSVGNKQNEQNKAQNDIDMRQRRQHCVPN